MDRLHQAVGIGGQKSIEIVVGQAVPDLSDTLPLRNMDAGKEHQQLFLVAGKPGIGHPAAVLLAGRIRFREAGDRDEASVFDTEPSLPMRKTSFLVSDGLSPNEAR